MFFLTVFVVFFKGLLRLGSGGRTNYKVFCDFLTGVQPTTKQFSKKNSGDSDILRTYQGGGGQALVVLNL